MYIWRWADFVVLYIIPNSGAHKNNVDKSFIIFIINTILNSGVKIEKIRTGKIYKQEELK